MRSWILFIFAVLIAYGSLYPFNFMVPEPHAAVWVRLFSDWSLMTSKADALGNIALFVPFGFAGVFAISDRPQLPVRVMMLALTSLSLATVLQIAQIYFPPRTPAMTDIVWNMAGTGMGIVAGLSFSARIQLRWQTWQRAHAIPLSLIILWSGAELLPFVPSLDLQSLKDALKALLRLHLSPPDIIWHAAGVLLLGRALTAMFGTARALQLLGVLVAVVIAGKVLVVTRVLNASTLVGFAVGYGVWRIVSGWKQPWRGDVVVLTALLAAYTLKALEPFELRPMPAGFSWLPFAGMLQGAMLINAEVLIESVFVFAGLLGLIRMQGLGVGASSVVLALWVGALEVAQMYIVGRSPNITEPLLVLLVGQVLRHAPVGTVLAARPYEDREAAGVNARDADPGTAAS